MLKRQREMSVPTFSYVAQLLICLLIQIKTISNVHLKTASVSAVRYKREPPFDSHVQDARNPMNAYVCRDDSKEFLKFILTCTFDENYSCRLTTLSTLSATTTHVIDLVSLTDHCQEPFNPRLFAKLGRVAYSQTEPFAVSQHQIFEMTLWFTNFTQLPSNYFCGLTNLTKLMMVNNTFISSKDLGFSMRDASQQCCNCKLQSLILAKNKIEILNEGSFLTFPNLTILDLSLNAISDIHNSAFVGLTHVMELNISHNDLTSLPITACLPLQTLIILDLSSNYLDDASFKSFRTLSNLKILWLSSNKISKITSEHFVGLGSLKELYLNQNDLYYLGSDLGILKSLLVLDLSENNLFNMSATLFDPATNLSVLDLRKNNFAFLPILNFEMDKELLKLDVSHNKLIALPVLTGLKKAKMLDFSNNLIERITEQDKNMLCNITLIENLHIENSSLLADFSADAFHCNKSPNSFHNLKLNFNKIKTISGVFKSIDVKTLSLNNNAITALSLEDMSPSIEHLDLSFNQIRYFSGLCQRMSSCNRTTALITLNLSYNRISVILDIFLPSHLKLLNLKYNDLTSFSFPEHTLNNTIRVTVPTHLALIDLSFNKLRFACPFIFYATNYDNMPAFKLTNNPLVCSCEAEFLSTREADFSLNPFRYSQSGSKHELPDISAQSNLLNISQLKNADRFSCSTRYANVGYTYQCNLRSTYTSLCKFSCPSSCQCFINSGYYSQLINCTHRNMSQIPDKTAGRIQINVDFSNNNLKLIGPSSLAGYCSSKALYLQHNQIHEIHLDAFQHVPDVRILNLSYNLLSYLPRDIFSQQTKLAELHLSHNRLSDIPSSTFQLMTDLLVLTLHNNALHNLSVWDLQDPKQQSSYFHLTLRNNPWSCECNYVNQFRDWFQNYSYIVDDASKVFCQMMDGCTAQVPMISFNSSHCYSIQTQYLNAFENVVQWSSILAVFLFLALLYMVMFRYRQEVQVIVYSRIGVRFFSKQTDGEPNRPYDAFIAYSSFDENFVMQTFVPGLEQIEKPYRVCIHQRDFLAGAMISESILEAIDKSRRTIVILSEHFVTSGWCRFEFKSAHMKMLTDRCSRVIVIILDTVPNDLDSEMKLYLKTNTYLKWGDLLFWKKLYFAMPDRKPQEEIDRY